MRIRLIASIMMSYFLMHAAATAQQPPLRKIGIAWWKYLDPETKKPSLGYSLDESNGDELTVTNCVNSTRIIKIKRTSAQPDSGPCNGEGGGTFGTWAFAVPGEIVGTDFARNELSVKIGNSTLTTKLPTGVDPTTLTKGKEFLWIPNGSLAGKSEATVSAAFKAAINKDTSDSRASAINEKFDFRLGAIIK